MSRTLRAGIVLGMLVLGLLLLGLMGHRSSARRLLLNYKAELRAQGEPLSVRELLGTLSTNANPSATVLSNAMLSLGSVRYNPGGLILRRFVGPGLAEAAWMQPNPSWAAWGSPTGQVSWAEIHHQLEGRQDALQALRAALKDPAPNSGMRTSILSGPVPNFVAIRTAAQWLMGSAVSRLQQGQRRKALEDLEAMAALARMNREDYTLVSQMLRIAVANLGLCATWEALQAPGWTEEELLRLQRAWEATDLVESLERGLVGERALGEELWDTMRRSAAQARRIYQVGRRSRSLEDVWRDYVMLPAYRLTSIDEDELFRLRYMQTNIASLRAVKAHKPWVAVKAQIDREGAELLKVFSSPARFRYLLSALSIPSFSKAITTGVRAETERQLTVTAIALQRYELRHHQPPPTLTALVPEFLSGPPWDCMSGGMPGYRVKPGGTFVLYSVGEDGRDDGGDASSTRTNRFELWECRDAVWPAARK